jgi:hypothetical protein
MADGKNAYGFTCFLSSRLHGEQPLSGRAIDVDASSDPVRRRERRRRQPPAPC